MTDLLQIVAGHPRRAILICAGIGVSVLAIQALWRNLVSRQTLPSLPAQKWKLSERCEIDVSSLNSMIAHLQGLLAELEPNKFHSELGRGKYELIASIIARLRGVCSDLQKYVSDDFLRRVPIEDIARSVWASKRGPSGGKTGGTLSVLSDDSFLSAYDDVGEPTAAVESRDLSISADYSAMDLYNKGLKAAERGEVTYRKSRAELCNCDSDQDFAAKLFGVRLAFTRIMADPQTVQWLVQSGRIIIADLLRHDKRDPSEFYAAYDRMIAFINDEKNAETIRTELAGRKVESTNLWDSLFDLVILDAFEGYLQKPPSSIAALMRNSFISHSMKQSTVNSLIWSMIKVKRQRLQVKDGFIAHFYDISQILTCSLAMGLLGGSPKEYQELCLYFKEQVFTFIMEVFNPVKVRYTRVEELADDIRKLMLDRVELLKVKLSNELIPL